MTGSRQWRWGLALFVAIGAVIRIAYLVAKFDDPLPFSDAVYYSVQAVRNTQGHWFRDVMTERPGATHAPLIVFYLTPWSLLPGDHVQWQRIGVTVLGVVAVALVGLLGRRIGGTRTGLTAAAIAAVYPNLWMQSAVVMSESLTVVVVAATLLLALRLIRSPSVAMAVATGAAVGLCALTRSELAVLAPAIALVVWRSSRTPRRTGGALLLLAAAVVVVAPWVIYNLGRFQETTLLTTGDGPTFVAANCDDAYHGRELGGWSIFCQNASDEKLGPAEESVRAAAQRDEGIAYARKHADRLPVVVAARVGRTLDLSGLPSLIDTDVGEDKPLLAVAAGIGAWWVLVPLAILGWRAVGARQRRDATRTLLALPLLSVAFTSVVFYGSHRLRTPAEPVVVVLAAAGIAARARRPHRDWPDEAIV